jgi:two-component system, OmpR family, response regulator MtrA
VRILVVDDDAQECRMIQFLLGEQGYQVDTIDNARGALKMIERQPPDLMLLDVNLPHLNGFEIYQRLREADYDLPVIFVTAKDDLEDEVHGLQLGADDYICKPFQPAQLTARVNAVLRRYWRAVSGERPRMRVGGLEIDVASMAVTLPDHRTVHLTLTEMKLLLELTQHPGEAVSRENLMDRVWGENYVGASNIVDVYIHRLRRKLERDPAKPRIIQSVRGVGYRLV